MKRTPVKILVALDSIIYAPLYIFIERNSHDKECPFLFQVEPVEESIEELTQNPYGLDSLAPISYDPLFSKVIVKKNFDEFKDIWFGVGDPLRVRRLQKYYEHAERSDEISFNYECTFIRKLALWIFNHESSKPSEEQVWNYNYVVCHPWGMTAYHIANFIFNKINSNTPVAPCFPAGEEINHLMEILKVDFKRKQVLINPRAQTKDQILCSAISTEIDDMLYRKAHFKFSEPLESFFLPKHFPANINVPKEFLMTCIFSRLDKGAEVDNASDVLKKGLKKIISDLQSKSNLKSLAKELIRFYDGRKSFIKPKKNILYYFNPEKYRRFIVDVLNQLSNNNLYSESLTPDPKSKIKCKTQKFIDAIIGSEEKTSKSDEYTNFLKLDNWSNGIESPDGKLW